MQDGQSAVDPGAANMAVAVPKAVARGAASHRGGTAINRPDMIDAPMPDRAARVSLSRNPKGPSKSLSRRNTARIAAT